MSKSNKTLMLHIFICIFVVTGCYDFFEQNIEDKVVYIIAPSDSLRTVISTQTFWWNYVNGADYYNLQIVSPGFDRINRLVLDTTISLDRFQFTLIPGVYEWRVSAFNSGYATPYTICTLFIDSTLDLSLQQVLLKNPASNAVTNNTRLSFRWDKIYSADLYVFEVRKGTWNGEVIVGPKETIADTISFIVSEGSYAWGVKASNTKSESQFSTRSILIDLTPPGQPILKAPLSGETFNGIPILLRWERPDIGGSALSDSIYIASDSVNFSGNIIGSYKTTNNWVNINITDDGEYYWRLRSIDAAGNKGPFSSIRRFNITED